MSMTRILLAIALGASVWAIAQGKAKPRKPDEIVFNIKTGDVTFDHAAHNRLAKGH
jgi:hypothetical protein